VEIACIRDRELLERGVKSLGMKREKLLRRLTELGGGFGAPWTQDEKYAALAAWLVLAETA
jgi:xanthine dehydrogenase molybdopterin-binding subunit B